MVPAPERRRASRISTSLSARLFTPDGGTRTLEVDELSILGLHGRADAPVDPGLSCRVELSTGTLSVDAWGTVVRAGVRTLAIRFERLPYESFERLRAFLLANARDPAVIADELAERMGFLEERA